MANSRASQRTRTPSSRATASQLPLSPPSTQPRPTARKRKATATQAQPRRRRRTALDELAEAAAGAAEVEVEEEEPGDKAAEPEEPVDEDAVSNVQNEEDELPDASQIVRDAQKEAATQAAAPKKRSWGSFVYYSQWTLRAQGVKEPLSTKGMNLNALHDFLWVRLQSYVHQYNSGSYQRKKVTLIARYQSLPQRDWHISEVCSYGDVSEVVKDAYRWYVSGKTGVRIDAEVLLEKVYDLTALEDEVVEVKAPVAKTVATPGRKTATKEQLAAHAASRAAAGGVADPSKDLLLRWLCEQKDCRNHNGEEGGSYCYWLRSNVAHNHYPLTGPAVKVWAAAIKLEEATTERPTHDVWPFLVEARERLKSKSHKKEPATMVNGGSTQPIINNYIGWQPTQQQRPSHDKTPEPPVSSQPSETVSDERYELFFRFIRPLTQWKCYDNDVDDIRRQLDVHGFDIDTAKRMTAAQWKECELKSGQYEKFIKDINKWLTNRKRGD